MSNAWTVIRCIGGAFILPHHSHRPGRDPKPRALINMLNPIPHGTIQDGFPRLGTPHPGQRTIICARCGAFMHADCASLDGEVYRCFMRCGGWSGGEAWIAWPSEMSCLSPTYPDYPFLAMLTSF
jgi:hypothetical protein